MTVFVSPSLLKDSFALLTDFFFSSILNISFFCLLASIVSDEKSAINHIVVPRCVMNHCSLATFKIFFSCCWWLDCDVFKCVLPLCVDLTWVPCNFCINVMYFFHKVWEISSNYFIKQFSYFPSFISMTTIILVHLNLFHCFRLFYFQFFRLHNFFCYICISGKFTK